MGLERIFFSSGFCSTDVLHYTLTCNKLLLCCWYSRAFTHPELYVRISDKHTNKDDSVDLPHPLVPHKSTVTDSFLSLILNRTIGKCTVAQNHCYFNAFR